MAPRKQRPGVAARGQFQCRRNTYDPETQQITGVCLKPVPEGELTYLALNALSGHYLALCEDCREELTTVIDEWLGASLGAARLLADLSEMPDGTLVSEHTLREALDADGVRAKSKGGPLTESERSIAVGLELARRARLGRTERHNLSAADD